jgi:pilus assembly protein Flp/PilA
MNKQQLIQKAKAFLTDEEGLTMVEYAVAGAIVLSAGAAAFITLGGAVTTNITDLGTAVTAANP